MDKNTSPMVQTHTSTCAIAFPMRVLPVPGGPKSRTPLGRARRPVKISGRSIGLGGEGGEL